jgi:hypothetical protein
MNHENGSKKNVFSYLKWMTEREIWFQINNNSKCNGFIMVQLHTV